MGQTISLTAADGLAFSAYVAEPAGSAKGGIVLLQEIFGVNSHIRSVADGYAAEGYLVVAPAMFQRIRPDVELGYTDSDMGEARALKQAVEALPAPGVMQDIAASIGRAAEGGKVAVMGYCWGGLLTWRAACMLPGLSAAVCFYGGGMTAGDEPARQALVPTLAHFADQDNHIPLDSVAAFQKAQPGVDVQVYAGQHGFNCDQRGSYDAAAAQLARQRTLAFLGQHLT
ncbi:carboxymethylenebutenolidase [Hydrogenophaga crassostreae]|uniref:Carboxymethylenebutenolidase n=1 Tax=Hydrogenophaga crassostreae TaxID=1763535 RepID=A0A167GU15_9BURK|nr:dienelactone hydrolase family protein [Hydrogenophaga crassostreae]AOW11789.1 carboxymethylenebutenolidase [Hydrogenophaga crassostreae]OAD39882.1 carboxymethylenebutenolidase [Hydrogenophaga crassostreae]